jgi:hypothetical protein
MKLLLDQGLPRSAAMLLREGGIDTLHVGEIGLAAATDNEILQRGRQEERVVVTLDADFHALLDHRRVLESVSDSRQGNDRGEPPRTSRPVDPQNSPADPELPPNQR